jgi:hypothetical protein
MTTVLTGVIIGRIMEVYTMESIAESGSNSPQFIDKLDATLPHLLLVF